MTGRNTEETEARESGLVGWDRPVETVDAQLSPTLSSRAAAEGSVRLVAGEHRVNSAHPLTQVLPSLAQLQVLPRAIKELRMEGAASLGGLGRGCRKG